MLSQLLHKSGLKARVVPHEAASRVHIGSLDISGVAMVCLCYLEIGGTPSISATCFAAFVSDFPPLGCSSVFGPLSRQS